jgi:hypothetical protein
MIIDDFFRDFTAGLLEKNAVDDFGKAGLSGPVADFGINQGRTWIAGAPREGAADGRRQDAAWAQEDRVGWVIGPDVRSPTPPWDFGIESQFRIFRGRSNGSTMIWPHPLGERRFVGRPHRRRDSREGRRGIIRLLKRIDLAGRVSAEGWTLPTRSPPSCEMESRS